MADDTTTMDLEIANPSESPSESDEFKDDARLSKMSRADLGEHARKAWGDWDGLFRRTVMELKINYLRWKGVKYAQPHWDPGKPFQVYVPEYPHSFQAQSFNEIERAVDTYVSQVLSDDPVMTALPEGQEDMALDAAEAASDAIRAEWLRMKINYRLIGWEGDAAIFRSTYAHLYWDKDAGGLQPARAVTAGKMEYVDREMQPVDDKGDAAKVWKGNLVIEQATPFEVRFSPGTRCVDEADEAMIGRIITLRQAVEMYPELKRVAFKKLMGEKMPENVSDYLRDFSGKSKRTSDEIVEQAADDTEASLSSSTDDTQRERLLDTEVFFLIYYRKSCRAYPDGYWCHVFGDGVVPKQGRGSLKSWRGMIPLAQLRCLHDPVSPIGRSLVDVLKSKQDALDFVLTQVFQYLRSFRTRYAVSTMGSVNTQALKNAEHEGIVYYDTEAPKTLEPPRMPGTLNTFTDFFTAKIEDATGIHGVSRGKHVPGVQSGRQAEALQQADQSILALSRTPLKEFCERLGKLILAGIKSNWTDERQVAFFGPDQRYVQKSFSRVDFGDTADVILEPGSLLMISPAQRAAIMNELVATQVMDAPTIRRLWPSRNVAGFALQEDPHYQKARREGDAFLEGPPAELIEAHQAMLQQVQQMQAQMQAQMAQYSLDRTLVGLENAQMMPPIDQVLGPLDGQITQIQEQFNMQLMEYVPSLDDYERAASISMIHVEEHGRTLSREKSGRLKEAFPWWYEAFQQHAVEHGLAAGVPGLAQPQPAPGQPAPAEASEPATNQPSPAGVAP